MEHLDEIKHKKDLILRYKKNLQRLEIQLAEDLYDLGLINAIDNVKKMIFQLEDDIESLKFQDSKKTTKLQPSLFPSQKYEDFVIKFSQEMDAWNGDKEKYEKLFLQSLQIAMGAKLVFIAHIQDGKWSSLSTEEKQQEVDGIVNSSESLVDFYWQATKIGGLSIGSIFDVKENAEKICLFLLFPDRDDYLLVLYGVNPQLEYDKGFEHILETILNSTKNLNNPLDAKQLEVAIYNGLKRKFGYVSDSMYNRNYFLFNQKLEVMTVHFEPIIHLSPTAPTIWGWEALARDTKTGKAPVDLFETAELWGVRFLLQLDMYFLKKAVDLYIVEKDPNDQSKTVFRRKNTMQPLSVNVHPESLLRSKYFETIKQIEKQGKMPLNKLYLEISEKAAIPIVDNWDGKKNITDAYREFLYKYKDLDINFSVDDFGVGFSSSSRVSRLGPAVVKIDRDALLDTFGNFTLEYITRIAKRMPGNTTVVVEGFDFDSKYSLKELYAMGIKNIQGHKYGKATNEIDDRLPRKIVEDICKQLAGE